MLPEYASEHEKIIVKIDMPPMPRLKKGDVAIIHPAVQQLLDFVVDQIFKELVAEHAARAHGGPLRTSDAVQSAIDPATEAEQKYKKPDYEIITVDEAVKRLGTPREAIMARFQQVADEYYALPERARARLHSRARDTGSADAATNRTSPKRRGSVRPR